MFLVWNLVFGFRIAQINTSCTNSMIQKINQAWGHSAGWNMVFAPRNLKHVGDREYRNISLQYPWPKTWWKHTRHRKREEKQRGKWPKVMLAGFSGMPETIQSREKHPRKREWFVQEKEEWNCIKHKVSDKNEVKEIPRPKPKTVLLALGSSDCCCGRKFSGGVWGPNGS